MRASRSPRPSRTFAKSTPAFASAKSSNVGPNILQGPHDLVQHMSTTSRPGSPSPASTSRSAAMSGGRRTSGGGPPSPPRPRAPTLRGARATSASRRRRLAPRAARDAPPLPATRRAAHPAMARTGATPRRSLAGSLARSLARVRPSRPQPPNHPLLVSHPLDGARTAPLAPAAPPAPDRRRAPRPRPAPRRARGVWRAR